LPIPQNLWLATYQGAREEFDPCMKSLTPSLKSKTVGTDYSYTGQRVYIYNSWKSTGIYKKTLLEISLNLLVLLEIFV